MATGILTAACLCLALSQGGGDIFHTNQRNHAIPVNVPDAVRAEMREFLLYASSDQGRSWQQVGVIPASKTSFAFYAPGDGTYWFQVASVNRQNVQDPDDKAIMKAPPHLKMAIDTVQPVIKSFQAQRHGDEVVVTWDVQEDHPDVSRDGIRLEYQLKDALIETWKPIPYQPNLKGQTTFTPGNKQTLVVRLTVRDLAGSQSYSTAEVVGTVAPASFVEPAVGVKPPVVTPPLGPEVVIPPPVFPKELTLPKPPPDLGKLPIAPPVEHKALFTNPGGLLVPPPVKEAPLEKVVADSRTPPQPGDVRTANASPLASTAMGRKPLPIVQYLNQHVVKLQYEIKRFGPSGIGGIEIWLTKDDGATWEAYAKVRENEVDKEAVQGRQERDFEFIDDRRVPFADGIYGLNLVVKNRAGMGRTPRPGDAPELRVEIDTEKPFVQLLEPVPDPQNPGHLLLRWYAADKNLTAAPINLEYAEKLDGPWQPIKLDVENSGRHTNPKATGDHSWKVPPGTPVQVYLRVRVRDKAGNEGIAATPTPQFVDLVEPEGALIGVLQPGRK